MISDGDFRKKSRILKSKDFRKIYKKGVPIKKGWLVLCSLPNDLGQSRIGFSISSRNVKSAVRRNRIRRLFKEVFRLNKGLIKAGYDIVIIIRRNPGKILLYKNIEKVFLEAVKLSSIHT